MSDIPHPETVVFKTTIRPQCREGKHADCPGVTVAGQAATICICGCHKKPSKGVKV